MDVLKAFLTAGVGLGNTLHVIDVLIGGHGATPRACQILPSNIWHGGQDQRCKKSG